MRAAMVRGDMEAAARSAINKLGESFAVRDLITFDVKSDAQGIAWLRMKLPSGRYLCYPHPEVSDSASLSYEGINQFTRKWQRLDTYGGKLVENAVQALRAGAYDYLAKPFEIDELKLTVDKALERERLLAEATGILPKSPDLLEWRVDHFGAIADTAAVIDTLRALRAAAGRLPPAVPVEGRAATSPGCDGDRRLGRPKLATPGGTGRRGCEAGRLRRPAPRRPAGRRRWPVRAGRSCGPRKSTAARRRLRPRPGYRAGRRPCDRGGRPSPPGGRHSAGARAHRRRGQGAAAGELSGRDPAPDR